MIVVIIDGSRMGVSKECNVKSNICAFVFRQTTSCHQRIVCVAVINQAHVCNLYPFIRNMEGQGRGRH